MKAVLPITPTEYTMLMDQPGSFDSQLLQIYATRGFLQQLSDSYRTRLMDDQVKYDNIGDSESSEKLRYEYMHAFCRWTIKPWRILPSC